MLIGSIRLFTSTVYSESNRLAASGKRGLLTPAGRAFLSEVAEGRSVYAADVVALPEAAPLAWGMITCVVEYVIVPAKIDACGRTSCAQRPLLASNSAAC